MINQRHSQRTSLPTKSQLVKLKKLNILYNTTHRDSVARKILVLLHQAGCPTFGSKEATDWCIENGL